MDVFTSFFQVLHSAIVSKGRPDRLWWVSSKRGLFKVKSFFSSLACSEGSCYPWRSVADSGSESATFEGRFFCVVGGLKQRSAAIWKMVPICIFFFCVWNKRNLTCFNDLESFMEDILASFFHTLYL